MGDMHEFQRHWALHYGGRVLNVGCKDDPANLRTIPGVVQIDKLSHDSFTNKNLNTLAGFINIDMFDYTPEEPFDVVVLGEFLEHCTEEMFHKVIKQTVSFIKEGGVLILTTPQDGRDKYANHGPDESKYYEISPGIVSWHQLYITKEMLEDDLQNNNMTIITYEFRHWLSGVNTHCIVARREK